MKRFLVSIVLVVSVVWFGFAGVKPFVDAYFSTSLFQNVDDQYLREHYGPYKYGEQYGDNRWYLRDSRLSFIFGLGVKEENLFGSVDFYVNSFLDGSTYLDINSGLVGYSDDVLTIKGFFKARSIKFGSPSDMFFSFLPSLPLFSSSFSRAHWFVPYFLNPIEFIDGSVEIFSTARSDTTNLVYSGKDYYGIYGGYFDGIIDFEGYFAKNIYGSISNLNNSSIFSTFVNGNYGGARLGVSGNVGFGDIYIGGVYRETTTNTLSIYMKNSDYRVLFFVPSFGSSNNVLYSLPYFDFVPSSYTFLGGYVKFDMTDFMYVGVEGGVISKNVYIGTSKSSYQDIYSVGGVLFKGIEGIKVELDGMVVIPDNKSNLSVLGVELKLAGNYESLMLEGDEFRGLLKVGFRSTKVEEPKYDLGTVVGIGNIGYVFDNVSVDLLGYLNNNSLSTTLIESTNLLFSDMRLYVGYNLSSLFDKKTRKDIGDNLWLKVGGRGVVQVGNVNVGNVGENTILTPYVGIWYQIPKVDSYIVLSYGWYGMTGVNDLDLGRGLESVVIMYNGAKDFSSGLVLSDNMASTVYSDGRYVNTGEYKLAVEPVIRFDMYIRY